MYHLFISGVTYLNSLWQAYRNGWRLVPSYVDALLDMQVCTSVMEGLACEQVVVMLGNLADCSVDPGRCLNPKHLGDGVGKDDPPTLCQRSLGSTIAAFINYIRRHCTAQKE